MKLKITIGDGGYTQEPTPETWDHWDDCPKGGITSKAQPIINLETLKEETGEAVIPSKFKRGEGYPNRKEFFSDIANGRD